MYLTWNKKLATMIAQVYKEKLRDAYLLNKIV